MRVDISNVKPGGTYESMLKTVGFVVVQWAHCEQCLELLTSTLFGVYDGRKWSGKKRIPKPLSEKLAFVSACADKIPLLSKFKSEIEMLVLEFQSLLQKRHDLVHGALTDAPIANGVFTFIRLETHPEIHELKEFQYDLKEFRALESALIHLGDNASKVARRVWDGRPHP
jgi:hypothetical protein